MARVSIVEWIIKKLKRCIAIVEDGDTASQAIATGKYVIWKGNACQASSAISQGDTLSSSNLTALSDGIGNELNSKFTYKTYDETPVANAVVASATNNAFQVYASKNISADVALYGTPVAVSARGYGDICVPASYNSDNGTINAMGVGAYTNTIKFQVLFMK